MKVLLLPNDSQILLDFSWIFPEDASMYEIYFSTEDHRKQITFSNYVYLLYGKKQYTDTMFVDKNTTTYITSERYAHDVFSLTDLIHIVEEFRCPVDMTYADRNKWWRISAKDHQDYTELKDVSVEAPELIDALFEFIKKIDELYYKKYTQNEN